MTTAGESVGNLHIIELAVLVSLLFTFLVPAVVCVSQFCGSFVWRKKTMVRGGVPAATSLALKDGKMIGWCF